MFEQKVAVVASKMRVNGNEIGTMTGVEMPSITLGTQDVQGSGLMGTLSLPSTGQFESMEMKFDLRGLSGDHALLMQPGALDIALLFAQDTVSVQAGIVPEGCKVYAKTVFKSYEPGSVKNGEPSEGSVTHEVLRLQIFVAGREILLIDKTAYIYRVNGIDRAADLRALIN